MIHICRDIYLDEREIAFGMIRAQGAGGQNVNKVASAVHLRFDAAGSSLPAEVVQALLALDDRRISADGMIVIKAQSYRSQARNRQDAIERLAELIRSVCDRPRERVATRPTRASQRRRVQRKLLRGRVKQLRGPVQGD